ncbi:DNA-3-methyladenine glycosylase [Leekyejoonella antrihumi]|uniref:Putative 3-methyladenine DNA glycosylase n=1 Tax=Leekyejoonella antrihumi TaxID=1660198 RepID=A0A563DSW3_9MICO|nr:DNA-3-methyladenine glycosylase [Leekyejoonella antrihumi]TWP33337.1 DNA-3-methyladenine glycosylase [Leekyejoonella antrihumi]
MAERATDEPPVLRTARSLLGRIVGHGGVTVRLTEVEAYAGVADPGSHAFRGPTRRNAVMFGPPGHLYVYFTYGMHHCMNVVLSPEGEASAVLLRAGAVVDGLATARSRRGRSSDRDLARGPARMTKCLAIDLSHNGSTIGSTGAGFVLGPAVAVDADSIRCGPRVGLSGPGGDGTAYPWRFWIDGEPSVSAYRPAKPRRRG